MAKPGKTVFRQLKPIQGWGGITLLRALSTYFDCARATARGRPCIHSHSIQPMRRGEAVCMDQSWLRQLVDVLHCKCRAHLEAQACTPRGRGAAAVIPTDGQTVADAEEGTRHPRIPSRQDPPCAPPSNRVHAGPSPSMIQRPAGPVVRSHTVVSSTLSATAAGATGLVAFSSREAADGCAEAVAISTASIDARSGLAAAVNADARATSTILWPYQLAT